MRSLLFAALVLTGLASLSAPRALAQVAGSLETLVMPGPVSRAHAESESDCGSCHVRLSNTTQSRLCLDCHEEVAADVAQRAGFHGRIPRVDAIECRNCHTEHAGRDADIVGLDRDTFEHGATDFPLRGAHAAVACEGCHAAGRRYREAASACDGCHRDDDVHDGRLGQTCEGCHSENTWSEVHFDHSATELPLVGRHAEIACNSCHVNERYAGLATDCYSCHRLNDAHNGTRGKACENCHSPRDWKRPTFDHDRDTSFPLEGAHAAVACVSCHEEDPYRVKIRAACVSCHRADDEHLGRNGEQCADCHTAGSWSEVTFDHEAETGFALRNRHAEISCAACHRGPIYEVALDASCAACHEADDPHDGQLGGGCDRCHGDAGWTDDVVFDHDITEFPLLGLHVAVPCEECHLTPAYLDASKSCVDCHGKDDVHAAKLGPDCVQCHTPAGWPLWRFDHDAQTDFPLEGAHHGLACDGCHRKPVTGKIELSTTCGSCHRADDVHRGRFGEDCGRCHTPRSFSDVQVPR